VTITYRVNPPLANDALNELFAAAWPDHAETDFMRLLAHSMAWVSAFDDDRLIGFVKLIWDGGEHAFLLDTTVHPDARRMGVGTRLVREAVTVARERGVRWLHVDYEPHLRAFYEGCGFHPTGAGLIRLRD
jgi:GNAT superfamily N-acetyltransferase